MSFYEILQEIYKASTIAIMPHISADGDALGSSLALMKALKMMNKEVCLFLEEEIPPSHGFLPGASLAEVVHAHHGPTSIAPRDLAIALDSSDLERLGNRKDIFNQGRMTICIDHHPTNNTSFAKLNLVVPEAAATSELVFQLIKLLPVELDADISTCLYVGLVADTGGFRLSNTTGFTHRMAAELVERGINVGELSLQIYENNPYGKIKLQGIAMNQLELLEEGRVALLSISETMLQSVGATDDDCDGLVNIGRTVRGVEVSIMLRQNKVGETRVNLRSKTVLDVSAIAMTFGGGGHKRAAGCTIKEPMDTARARVLEEVRKAILNETARL